MLTQDVATGRLEMHPILGKTCNTSFENYEVMKNR